jgi:S1-C subfamily serine protease
MIEGAAWQLRHRVVRSSVAEVLDGSGGALLIAALGLGIAWMFGVVALNAPNARELRSAVQRSAILRGLNHVFPPAGVLNTLHRIDPRLSIRGPAAQVAAPDPSVARDPEVGAAGASVVRVLGTACGLGVEGSGWVAAPDLVVTNAHVVAGERDTTVTVRDGATHFDATPVHFDSVNDLAVLRVTGLSLGSLSLVPQPKPGVAGAVLGYPENGPFTVSAARLGATRSAISEDAYGRGPLRRTLVSLRGRILSGNSGGPMVDEGGRVLTTVFASTTSGKPGGFGIPNAVVSEALLGSGGEVSTGPCTR